MAKGNLRTGENEHTVLGFSVFHMPESKE